MTSGLSRAVADGMATVFGGLIGEAYAFVEVYRPGYWTRRRPFWPFRRHVPACWDQVSGPHQLGPEAPAAGGHLRLAATAPPFAVRLTIPDGATQVRLAVYAQPEAVDLLCFGPQDAVSPGADRTVYLGFTASFSPVAL